MNLLREKLNSGKKLAGTHVNITEPFVCEMIGGLGYDFIWIDMEHSYISYKELNTHIMAARAGGIASLVRVPPKDFTATKKILEMGPDGIIFPMVESEKDVEPLIEFTLYPPQGVRGFGPMGAIGYGKNDVDNYIKKESLDICRFIQIERASAVDDIEALSDNPFIDAFIFGPNDLSGSINELGNVFGENTTKLIERASTVLKRKGKHFGVSTSATDEKTLRHWNSFGMDIISSGADYLHMLNGFKSAIPNIRKVQDEIIK